MAGLKGQFKTNAKLAADGKWFEYPAAANSDKTIPAFKLASARSRVNKAFALASKEVAVPYVKDGKIIEGAIEELNAAVAEAFARHVIRDWRNFQPNDDGVNEPFSVEKAVEILTDPEWTELYDDLYARAENADNFRDEQVAKTVKN